MNEQLRPDLLSLQHLSRRAKRAAYKAALSRKFSTMDSGIDYIGNYAGATTQRGRSGLWGAGGGCPWATIMDGSVSGIAGTIDPSLFPISVANTSTVTTEIPLGGFRAYAISGSTIGMGNSSAVINSVVVPGSAIQFNTDNTSGHQASLCMAGAPFTMTGSSATSGKLWWEACIAVSTIGSTATSFFAGLAETDAQNFTLGASIPLTSGAGTAVSNTASMIGFNLACAGVGQMKTGYNDRATSLTYVGSTDCTLLKTYTFTRIGMFYDPNASGTLSTQPGTCAVQFWQDGVQLPNGITNATLVATTNLDANGLGPVFAVTNGGTAAIMYLAWSRWAQVYPN